MYWVSKKDFTTEIKKNIIRTNTHNRITIGFSQLILEMNGLPQGLKSKNKRMS